MITIRRSEERGKANHGWLQTYHTFSFADYYDPEHMGFRSLRVINEDIVAPKMGFDTHPHRDMEIISYIVSGKLAHKDSLGNGRTILPGEVQAMSAGTGVRHSEFNASDTEPVHLLQIWIVPDKKNLPPSYSEWKPGTSKQDSGLTLLASQDGSDLSVKIHQNVSLFLGEIATNQTISHDFLLNRYGWIQMIEGELETNGLRLAKGDGASISNETKLEMKGISKSKFLLFDLS